MITDGSGNVVYSASYSPFGKLHKVWLNTYDPSLKFSGKEREATSGDDYFGARYFSGDNYRFLSVDPVRNRTEALANPKLWNLYSYCRNNPITFHDPDGRRVNPVTNQWGVEGPAPYFFLAIGLGNIARSERNPSRGLFGETRTNPDGSPKDHYGIDIIARVGLSIHNAEQGQVIQVYAGGNGDWGNFVKIRSIAGYVLIYAHLSSINSNIKKGAWVKEGDVIGKSGISGWSGGRGKYHHHLHFEVRNLNNESIDPRTWLNDVSQKKSSNFQFKLYNK